MRSTKARLRRRVVASCKCHFAPGYSATEHHEVHDDLCAVKVAIWLVFGKHVKECHAKAKNVATRAVGTEKLRDAYARWGACPRVGAVPLAVSFVEIGLFLRGCRTKELGCDVLRSTRPSQLA
jgi:hypothetical protein